MAKYHHGDLKADLIQKAVTLLHQGENFSLRGLAKEVGVTPAAVYRHFPNKDALLMTVAIEGFELLEAEFKRIDSREALERLKDLGQAYIEFALQYPGHYKVMFGEFQCSTEDEMEFANTGVSTFSALMDSCKELTESETQATNLAIGAWSLVHGYSMLAIQNRLSVFGESTPPVHDILEQFWHKATIKK